MLVERQRSLTKSVVRSLSIARQEEVDTKTVESIKRAERRENPFNDLSTERKKVLLRGLLAKSFLKRGENIRNININKGFQKAEADYKLKPVGRA